MLCYVMLRNLLCVLLHVIVFSIFHWLCLSLTFGAENSWSCFSCCVINHWNWHLWHLSKNCLTVCDAWAAVLGARSDSALLATSTTAAVCAADSILVAEAMSTLQLQSVWLWVTIDWSLSTDHWSLPLANGGAAQWAFFL